MNLYVHFPFCRRKCTYCALHSRAGSSAEARAKHVEQVAAEAKKISETLSTVYFGGGSPALCDLSHLLDTLRPLLAEDCEFTVELHPLDVRQDLLKVLKAGGVNRISMGVQSLDDATLARMGRGYTFDEAERAFALVRRYFDNAGIDLIIGYPGDSTKTDEAKRRLSRLAGWELKHCSAYSLILEESSILAKRKSELDALPDDDTVLDEIRDMAKFLASIELRRYEISNYSVPGFECRHNMAVWRGEDYIGLGEGAHGRIGLSRTVSGKVTETMTAEEDATERRIFRLRTIEGLDAAGHPEWMKTLDRFYDEGFVLKQGSIYRLTERGTEVCDSLLAELV